MPRETKSETTVKMKETANGSRTGIATETFLKDKVYTIPSSLAEVFIEIKAAVLHKGKDSKEDNVDPGDPTGLVILKEGMITRDELAEDNLNNKALHDYAVVHLGEEDQFLPLNTKHSEMLKAVISKQQAWEEENFNPDGE